MWFTIVKTVTFLGSILRNNKNLKETKGGKIGWKLQCTANRILKWRFAASEKKPKERVWLKKLEEEKLTRNLLKNKKEEETRALLEEKKQETAKSFSKFFNAMSGKFSGVAFFMW